MAKWIPLTHFIERVSLAVRINGGLLQLPGTAVAQKTGLLLFSLSVTSEKAANLLWRQCTGE